MRAVVTGGCGFIGSHLVDRLAADGSQVLIIDNLSSGTDRYRPAGVMLKTENVTTAAAREMAAAFRPDVIFHLAAQIDVARSVADPCFDARVSVLGTVSMLEAARRCGARLVFASSGGAVYGDTSGWAAPEGHKLAPESPYGMSKLAAEGYVRLYSPQHVILRLANVYGPRQGTVGEGGVIAVFARAVHGGSPVTVFGDGEQTRDFVYVEDVAEAFLLAAEHKDGGTFNISTGQETSVNDLWPMLGIREVSYGPPRAGDVRYSCLSNFRARAALSWKPETSLADGLARTSLAKAREALRK
jgi:UDP-glucose 4-epimerase